MYLHWRLVLLVCECDRSHFYNLQVHHLSSCGVRDCEEQGESWLCLMVRFPALAGLKLPEDEVIDIKCRPQDRSIAGNSVVNFQENV